MRGRVKGMLAGAVVIVVASHLSTPPRRVCDGSTNTLRYIMTLYFTTVAYAL
jgi:hypothetical protein